MPLTKGQQRTHHLGDWHPLHRCLVCACARQDGCPSPHGRFALCRTGWNGEGLSLSSSTPCPGSPFSSALDMSGPNPLGEAPKQPSPTTLIWLNSCWPLRLDSVKLRIY